MGKFNWSNYYKVKVAKPPSKLLVEALSYINNRKKALDLGAGALVDSKLLLDQGFEVTAVDNSPEVINYIKDIRKDRFTFIQVASDLFDYQPDAFNLVSAQFALPFNPRESFPLLFSKIRSSLKG